MRPRLAGQGRIRQTPPELPAPRVGFCVFMLVDARGIGPRYDVLMRFVQGLRPSQVRLISVLFSLALLWMQSVVTLHGVQHPSAQAHVHEPVGFALSPMDKGWAPSDEHVHWGHQAGDVACQVLAAAAHVAPGGEIPVLALADARHTSARPVPDAQCTSDPAHWAWPRAPPHVLSKI